MRGPCLWQFHPRTHCSTAGRPSRRSPSFHIKAQICQLQLIRKSFHLSFPLYFYLVGVFPDMWLLKSGRDSIPLHCPDSLPVPLSSTENLAIPQLKSNQRPSVAPRMKSKFLILASKSLQDPVLDKHLSGLVCHPPPTATSQHHQQSHLLSSHIRDHSACVLLSRYPFSSIPTFPFWLVTNMCVSAWTRVWMKSMWGTEI